MCDTLTPDTRQEGLDVRSVCPQNPNAGIFLYRMGILHSVNLASGRKAIQHGDPKDSLSAPLAWNMVLPYLQTAEQARRTPTEEFAAATRDAVALEFGLEPSTGTAREVSSGRYLSKDTAVLEKQLYLSVDMIFAHQGGTSEKLRSTIEAMAGFPDQSAKLDYWRLLYFVLSRYLTRHRGELGSAPFVPELLQRIEWYSVHYVAGDALPLRAVEDMLDEVFRQTFYNVWAGYRVDFLHDVLGRAGGLLPSETVAALSLPGFSKLATLSESIRGLAQAYSKFQTWTKDREVLRDLLRADRLDGPLYRLHQNISTLKQLSLKWTRKTNTAILQLMLQPAMAAEQELVREEQVASGVRVEVLNRILRQYASDITEGTAALLEQELPEERDTQKVPLEADAVLFDLESGFTWESVVSAYRRESEAALARTFAQTQAYENYVERDENVKQFNETYLNLPRYTTEQAIFSLFHFGDRRLELARIRAARKKWAVFVVWNPGRLISTLNLYVLEFDSAGKIDNSLVLNLSHNVNPFKRFDFPSPLTVFDEQAEIFKALASQVPFGRNFYAGYEPVFGEVVETKVHVLFFGLWYAEMYMKGFSVEQMRQMRLVVGKDTFLNFLRVRYVARVLEEATRQ